jgi:hypothetical protein
MLSTAVQTAVEWPGDRQVALLFECVDLCRACIDAVLDAVPADAAAAAATAGQSEPVAVRAAQSAAAEINAAAIEGRHQAQNFMRELSRLLLHKLGCAVVEAVRFQQQQQQQQQQLLQASIRYLPQEAWLLLRSYSLLVQQLQTDGRCDSDCRNDLGAITSSSCHFMPTRQDA